MTEQSSLFAALLGDDYRTLPPAVRALHDAARPVRFRGRAQVESARGRLARLVARVAGLPDRDGDLPVAVTFMPTSAGERWQRDFGGRPMRSRLWRDGDHLCERLGAATLRFRLVATETGTDWQLLSVRIFGMPLPRAWFRQVHASESERDGRYHFQVRAALPLIGMLVAYQGWLDVDRAGSDRND